MIALAAFTTSDTWITSIGLRLSVAATLSLLLTACSSGPPPRLYLLNNPTADVTTPGTDVSSLRNLGISQITLPGYADDPRIATLDGDGVVVQMDDQRWAEEPEDAITRYFADQLRRQANATVLVEPWPRDYNPQSRVEIVFGRLLRDADGGAFMSGQILLLSGDGRKLLQSLPFNHRVAGRSTASVEFFNAVAVGIDELVRLTIDSLLSKRSAS